MANTLTILTTALLTLSLVACDSTVEELAALGMVAAPSDSPESLENYIAEETERLGAVAKAYVQMSCGPFGSVRYRIRGNDPACRKATVFLMTVSLFIR